MKNNSPWISATDVATWTFCPESWRLGQGLKLKPNNPHRLKKGTAQHAHWQTAERGSSFLIKLGLIILALALGVIVLRTLGW